MADIVNLNRFRKAKKRADDKERASANLAAFGRTKAERRKETEERERVRRDLDSKKVDP